MDKSDIWIVAILGIAALAVVGAFLGGTFLGSKTQGVIFERDNNGRISAILTLPNVMR